MDTHDADIQGTGEPGKIVLEGGRNIENAIIPDVVTRSFAQDVVARVAGRVARKRDDAKSVRRATQPSSIEIDALCEALLSDNPNAAAEMIESARAVGRSPDSLYLDYIAPAARNLGKRWEDDIASFLDVTLACARLQGVVHNLSPMFHGPEPVEPNGLAALFAAVPDETHEMGVTIASEFFQRSGWHVDHMTGPNHHTLIETAAQGSFELIGLSAGCRAVTDSLLRAVKELRRVSPGSVIALGGYLTHLDPDIKERSGVDVILGNDVATAPDKMQRLVVKRTASIDSHSSV